MLRANFNTHKEDKEDKTSPVEDYLENLPNKIEARFLNCFEHLVINQGVGVIDGVIFKKLHSYPFEEIRVKESKKLHRIVIQIRVKDTIIVLHGFTKQEGMNEKAHKKLLDRELKEAQRRYERLVSATSEEDYLIG